MSHYPLKKLESTAVRNVRIEVRNGRTINMGNYESERIDAGLSFDIDGSDLATIERAYAEAWGLVGNQIDLLEARIQGDEYNG